MSKIMLNLIVLMEPSDRDNHNISLKGGNVILNRFCINEVAAFELSGVNYLKTTETTAGKALTGDEKKRKRKGQFCVPFYLYRLFHPSLHTQFSQTVYAHFIFT